MPRRKHPAAGRAWSETTALYPTGDPPFLRPTVGGAGLLPFVSCRAVALGIPHCWLRGRYRPAGAFTQAHGDQRYARRYPRNLNRAAGVHRDIQPPRQDSPCRPGRPVESRAGRGGTRCLNRRPIGDDPIVVASGGRDVVFAQVPLDSATPGGAPLWMVIQFQCRSSLRPRRHFV